MADQLPSGARVLVVGGEGLRVALRERGLVPVESADEGPVAVAQGFGGPDLAWGRFAEAAYAISRGAVWFASNTDLTIPGARGIAPGNGAAVEVVRIATGAEPQVAGKPLPPMHRETVLRTGAKRPLVVGDRLDTDIEGAFNGGVDSLLVLTGVTDAAQLIAAGPEHRPTYVDRDLRGLLTGQPEVSEADGAFRCGGWTAVVRGDALVLEGDGEGEGGAIDGLRALCAAAWTYAGEGSSPAGRGEGRGQARAVARGGRGGSPGGRKPRIGYPNPVLVESPSETNPGPTAAPDERPRAGRHAAWAAGLLVAVGVLVLVCLASVAIGAKALPLSEVWHGLFHYSGSNGDVLVRDVRVPRTVLGLIVGAALGLAGAVMQALTRNPLAEPGLLGVNAGASAAVVSAITFLGVTSLTGYVWFAFGGAAVVSVAVYLLGGSRSANPVRLALMRHGGHRGAVRLRQRRTAP